MDAILNSDLGPQISKFYKSDFKIYKHVLTFLCIETVVYIVVPMVFNSIELADPGEKKRKRVSSAAILDAIFILRRRSINY